MSNRSRSSISNQESLCKTDNIERFNRLYREAVLDAYLFFDLDQVRQLTAEWIEEYNLRQPHESLDNLTPDEWNKRLMKQEIV